MLKSLLIRVSLTGPVTFATTAGALTAVSLLACWMPARRAAKVNPVEALLYEQFAT